MTLEEKAEKTLVQRLLTKESSAWKEVYDLFSGNFSTICYRYIKNREDHRDILQNSFVKMFGNIHQFQDRGKGSLRAWMSRIVVNECLQFLRLNGQIQFNDHFEWDNIPDEDQEPEVKDLSAKEILEYISELSDGYRTIFNLYVFEGKSHKEIALLLNISEGTSASQFSRAKKILATKIKNYQLLKTNVL